MTLRLPRLGPPAPAALLLASVLALTLPTLAHQGGSVAEGFASGFLHPVRGVDHVVAMVAVGLWGGLLGAPALWLLPIAFPLVMALGGAAGTIGLPLPAVEIGIAASAIVLGAAVAGDWKPPLALSGTLVGVFAIFHGHAHGTELPGAADPMAYGVGFVTATGLLHLTGILFGLGAGRPRGRAMVRGTGMLVAGVGIYFLLQAI